MGLQRGKSVIVNPVFNLASIILPIFTGTIVFLEQMTSWKIISTVIILVGAVILSIPKKGSLVKEEKNEE